MLLKEAIIDLSNYIFIGYKKNFKNEDKKLILSFLYPPKKGERNDAGSEHKVDGIGYPLEVNNIIYLIL